MENNNQNLENVETSAIVEEVTETKKKNSKNIFSSIGAFFKKSGNGKIKNQALLRRGGYSLAITSIVLAGLIILNWLVSLLADNFNLVVDMTADKKNSISEKNEEYVKNLDADVTITIIGTEADYSDAMVYYAENYYGITLSQNKAESQYFDQTITLVSKYHDHNKRIVVKYIDPQSTEFTAITTTYADYSLTYGDMIVTSNSSGKDRVKVLKFTDIYVLSSSGSNSYYQSYSLTANKLETALTSAIAYVTSSDNKKVAILSGHSTNNYADAYKHIIATNNYEVDEITDKLITSISNEYDAIIISAPTIDFIGSELDIIAAFLENDGKKGKGLIYFADATCPALPNFTSFLKQWGIEVGEGILFETNSNNHIPNQPTTIGLYPTELEDDDINEKINMAIANYIVPMKVCEAATLQRKSTALMQTLDSTVVAPVGSSSTWADYKDEDKKQYDCVIQSVETDFDSDNNQITSYIMAFASVEFIQSDWASQSSLSNQDIVMACSDRAAHVGDTSITFTSKVIKNESFITAVTEGSAKVVMIIFVFIVPVAIIAAGIAVFIRRRNAQ